MSRELIERCLVNLWDEVLLFRMVPHLLFTLLPYSDKAKTLKLKPLLLVDDF